MRTVVTPKEVEKDPTNVYLVSANGDVAIKRIVVHDTWNDCTAWLFIEYANGGSSSGTPAHWHTFVRITDDPSDTVFAVRIHYNDGTAPYLAPRLFHTREDAEFYASVGRGIAETEDRTEIIEYAPVPF